MCPRAHCMCRRVDPDTRLLLAGLAGPRSDKRDVRTQSGWYNERPHSERVVQTEQTFGRRPDLHQHTSELLSRLAGLVVRGVVCGRIGRRFRTWGMVLAARLENRNVRTPERTAGPGAYAFRMIGY